MPVPGKSSMRSMNCLSNSLCCGALVVAGYYRKKVVYPLIEEPKGHPRKYSVCCLSALDRILLQSMYMHSSVMT
jgi:hypothetical protein